MYHSGSAALGCWSILNSQVLAQTVSFHPDLSGTHSGGNSNRGGCAHREEARILEAADVTPHIAKRNFVRASLPWDCLQVQRKS